MQQWLCSIFIQPCFGNAAIVLHLSQGLCAIWGAHHSMEDKERWQNPKFSPDMNELPLEKGALRKACAVPVLCTSTPYVNNQ